MSISSSYKTIVSTSIGSFVTDRRVEIGLLFGILFGLFCLVSMVGFQSTDPTLLRESVDELRNPCGPIGANIADLLFTIFGIGAWGIAGLVATAVLGMAGRSIMSGWQWLATFGLVVTILSFAQLIYPGVGPHPTGGAIGFWTLGFLESGLGQVGAGLVLLGIATILMTVAAQLRWQSVATWSVERVEIWVPQLRSKSVIFFRWCWVRISSVAGGMSRKWKGAGRRMWESLTRQGIASNYDATWAEDLGTTHVTDAFSTTGVDSVLDIGATAAEYEVAEESGDTVVGDAESAVVHWESTRPGTEPGTSSGQLMEFFPDFAPRPTRVGIEGVAEQNFITDEEPLHTASEIVEPRGVHAPENVADKVSVVEVSSVVSETASVIEDEVPSTHSNSGSVDVSPSKYLENQVKDDGRALRKSKRKEPWKLPPLALLNKVPKQSASVDSVELREKAKLLEEKLKSFKVMGKVVGIRPGPVVTIFEFLPDPGIKVSSITKLSDDLAMALKAMSVRIVAPIPGRGVVGIEIPSAERMTIYLREMLASGEFRETKAGLPCVIGKDVVGKPVVSDLARMPHLLVGGTTGSGKSVGVNGMLMSMLFTLSPDELRLLLIDPKMLEFEMYGDIPHLLHPVVTDPKIAAQALEWACREMDDRYRLLAKWGTRNIVNYNEKVTRELKSWNMEKARKYAPDDCSDFEVPPKPEKLPYIVIVIDELADLMMVASKDVESSICRIAQKARACGIHLIVATQRPSVDVVTGLIKANLPTRIAFQLRSRVDSRTVLDEMGAEHLLGMGDMLYLPPGVGTLHRCHGAFVSDDEVDRVTTYLREQVEPGQLPVIDLTPATSDDPWSEEQDEYYDRAVELVVQKGKASTSMIQRRFSIGYNRAARIVDQMESRGIIGAADGAKPRSVLTSMPA